MLDAWKPKWMEQAACAGADVALFFPRSEVSPRVAQAKAICQSCDVQPQCLDFAFETQSEGIWGGYTDEERKELKPFYG